MRRSLLFGVIGLTVLYFVLALCESLVKSPSSDEPPHIASGLAYVSEGNFRGNRQHPPLLKELSGLSLLLGGIRWPKAREIDLFLHSDWPPNIQPEWEIGNMLIASGGPDRVLFWARLPLLLISSALGLLVYLWGREMFGELAGACAAFLCMTDPIILGQSFMVTMDPGLTVFSVLFFYTLWRYLRSPSVPRMIWCGVALGVVLAVKFSAVMWLPVAGVLLAAAVVWPMETDPGRKRAPLDPYYIESGENPEVIRAFRTAGRNDVCPCGSGKKFKACHGAQKSPSLLAWYSKRWVLCVAVLGVMLVAAAVVIEAVYFFPKDLLAYVHGAQQVNADHRPDYLAFMAGELRPHFSSYFLVAYLFKEPLAALLLTAVGAVLLFRSKSVTPIRRVFLLLPPVLFFAGTAILADQIGVRYIMPVLPFAHLLGGLALAALFTMPARWCRWAGGALCVWLLLALAGVYPDHLAYFNEAACLASDPGKLGLDDGTKCGVAWLDDSNVDWGQGLKQLKAWLDVHAKGRPIKLASVFQFPPETYGIQSEKATVLAQGAKPPGLYVISAGLVARIPTIPAADNRFRGAPVAVVGHAFYIYELP